MTARRRLRARGLAALLALTGLGLAALPLAAQVPGHEPVAGAAPDVPAGEAALNVRLASPEAPEVVADAEVILYALSPDGQPGLRRSQTDAEGRVRFENLSAAPGVVYLVGTRIAGVPFGTRTTFAEGERERDVVVEVRPPTADASAVTPGPLEIQVSRGCSDLRLRHVHTLDMGATERVVHVPADRREGATPLLEVQLPEGASEIETPLGAAPDAFEREGRTLRFWGPLYPDDPRIEFGYALPQGQADAVAVDFPRGSGAVTVLAPRDGVEVRGEALVAGEPLALPSGEHSVSKSEALAPGGRLAFALSAQEVAPEDRVQLAEARIWVELDDAAMEVNEVHLLEVTADGGLPARASAPLLCLPVPEDAQDLRLSNAALEMGLSRDAGGAVAIEGPLPAGESNVALRYRLPALTEPAVFERSFARPLPLLSLFVADTGLVPHTTRLHNRRPVRTEDRAYLHLEGFGIEAGEPVRVAFERISLAGGMPGFVSGGFVFLAACIALFFLVSPLRRDAPEPVETEALPERSTEREAVYRAIEALDEDFETGKLSAEDHARMRDELRARAVALLQAEREAEARARQEAAPPEPSAETVQGAACPACGTRPRAGDRFCAACGASLERRETAAS